MRGARAAREHAMSNPQGRGGNVYEPFNFFFFFALLSSDFRMPMALALTALSIGLSLSSEFAAAQSP